MRTTPTERSSDTGTDSTPGPGSTQATPPHTAPTTTSLDEPRRAGFASRWLPDVVEATLTTTCVSCGGLLQVGHPQLLVAGHPAHAICAVFTYDTTRT